MRTPLEELAVLGLRPEWVEKATEQDAEDVFEVGAEFVPMEALRLLAHKFPGITFRHAADVPKEILQPVCRANPRLAVQHRLVAYIAVPVAQDLLRQEPELLFFLTDGQELDTYLSEDLARELAEIDPLTVLRRSPQRLRSKDVTDLAARLLEDQHRKRGYEASVWSSYALGTQGRLENNSLRFFSTALGCVGQGWLDPMGVERTNLREAGRIYPGGGGGGFRVEAVQYMIENATEEQAQDIAQSCVLRWDFVQTQIDIGVCADFSDRGTATRGIRFYPRYKTGQGTNLFMNSGRGTPTLQDNTTFGVCATFGMRAPDLSSTSPKKPISLRITLLGNFFT